MVLKIPRRSRCCSQCNGEFQPGEELYSMVLHEGDGIYLREDYCVSCVPSNPAATARWHVPFPTSQKQRPSEEEMIDQWRECVEGGSDAARAYLLTHYLLRRGVLRRLSRQEDPLLVEVLETGESFAVSRVESEKVQGCWTGD